MNPPIDSKILDKIEYHNRLYTAIGYAVINPEYWPEFLALAREALKARENKSNGPK